MRNSISISPKTSLAFLVVGLSSLAASVVISATGMAGADPEPPPPPAPAPSCETVTKTSTSVATYTPPPPPTYTPPTLAPYPGSR